ncbi:MAG: hypothetical protein BM555_01935 [Crocinitomix sp. MedPE-SWsnd]|nr:MAG: hypothetical protein BM555_01935 [Crocinitomix sp. MedPE-SWsnd]
MRQRITLLILFLFFIQDLFAQCAMCKAVAEDTEVDSQSSLNTGILYIMVVPYILLFVLFRKKIFSFIREMRTAKG